MIKWTYEKIKIPTISEILQEEFMEPNNLSFDDLSLYLSKEQLIDISDNKITPEISLLLAKAFNVSDNYFINIQEDLNRRNA